MRHKSTLIGASATRYITALKGRTGLSVRFLSAENKMNTVFVGMKKQHTGDLAFFKNQVVWPQLVQRSPFCFLLAPAASSCPVQLAPAESSPFPVGHVRVCYVIFWPLSQVHSPQAKHTHQIISAKCPCAMPAFTIGMRQSHGFGSKARGAKDGLCFSPKILACFSSLLTDRGSRGG